MSNQSVVARLWEPKSRIGLALSVTSVWIFAILFWWAGIAAVSDSLATLSVMQYSSGIVLGLLLGAGTLAIHTRPSLRERWRTSLRLRLTFAVPLGIIFGVLITYAPAVLSLGFIIFAVVFTVGRVYLYISA